MSVLTIKYGDYVFAPNPLVTVSSSFEYDEAHQIRGERVEWRLEGALVDEGAVALSQKLAALKKALSVTDRKAVILKGGTEILALDPDDGIEPIRCTSLEIPEGAAGAWTTNLRYSIVLTQLRRIFGAASTGLLKRAATLKIDFATDGLMSMSESGEALFASEATHFKGLQILRAKPLKTFQRDSLSVTKSEDGRRVTWSATDKEVRLDSIHQLLRSVTLRKSWKSAPGRPPEYSVDGSGIIAVREIPNEFELDSTPLKSDTVGVKITYDKPTSTPLHETIIRLLIDAYAPPSLTSASVSFSEDSGAVSFSFSGYGAPSINDEKRKVLEASVSLGVSGGNWRSFAVERFGHPPVVVSTTQTPVKCSLSASLTSIEPLGWDLYFDLIEKVKPRGITSQDYSQSWSMSAAGHSECKESIKISFLDTCEDAAFYNAVFRKIEEFVSKNAVEGFLEYISK